MSMIQESMFGLDTDIITEMVYDAGIGFKMDGEE